MVALTLLRTISIDRCRILEIEHYYEIDEVEDLEIWKREYNIPPREMAPVVSSRWKTVLDCRTLESDGSLGRQSRTRE